MNRIFQWVENYVELQLVLGTFLSTEYLRVFNVQFYTMILDTFSKIFITKNCFFTELGFEMIFLLTDKYFYVEKEITSSYIQWLYYYLENAILWLFLV